MVSFNRELFSYLPITGFFAWSYNVYNDTCKSVDISNRSLRARRDHEQTITNLMERQVSTAKNIIKNEKQKQSTVSGMFSGIVGTVRYMACGDLSQLPGVASVTATMSAQLPSPEEEAEKKRYYDLLPQFEHERKELSTQKSLHLKQWTISNGLTICCAVLAMLIFKMNAVSVFFFSISSAMFLYSLHVGQSEEASRLLKSLKNRGY